MERSESSADVLDYWNYSNSCSQTISAGALTLDGSDASQSVV